ncbi:hypothetical protein OG21DRAFT_1510773 [Imleria badia]|nr:hypothetical protein OG21DRAFT_1510773 [Imleria badia]
MIYRNNRNGNAERLQYQARATKKTRIHGGYDITTSMHGRYGGRKRDTFFVYDAISNSFLPHPPDLALVGHIKVAAEARVRNGHFVISGQFSASRNCSLRTR